MDVVVCVVGGFVMACLLKKNIYIIKTFLDSEGGIRDRYWGLREGEEREREREEKEKKKRKKI